MTRAAIVSGAARGLGLALVAELLQHGVRVVALCRQPSAALLALTSADASQLQVIEGDLADPNLPEALLQAALAALGPGVPDELALINNAGTLDPIAISGQLDPLQLQHAMQVNLLAPMRLCNALLASAGPTTALRILNISSGAACKVYPGWSGYGTAKAGIDHFSRHLAAEHPALRVAAVYPGVIDTAMQQQIRATKLEDFPGRARFDELYAHGQLTTPQQVAQQLVSVLYSPAFGSEPVFDLRELS